MVAPAAHTHEGREKRGGGRDGEKQGETGREGQNGVAHMDRKRK